MVDWKILVDERWQYSLLHACDFVCYCPLTVGKVGENIRSLHEKNRITGGDVFIVHCHCNSPGSLKCKAIACYLKNILYKYLLGCEFNCKYHWVRKYLNSGPCYDQLKFEGGVVTDRGLIMYYSSDSFDASTSLLPYMSSNLYIGNYKNQYFLQCFSIPESENDLWKLLENVKKILNCGHMNLRHYGFKISVSDLEEKQEKLLRSFYKYGFSFYRAFYAYG